MTIQGSYTQTRKRMEDILVQVRSKDVPLEKSLDLYEEALAIGARCADLIDSTDFSAEEMEPEIAASDSTTADITAASAAENAAS